MQPKTSVGRDFQDTILGRLADRGQITTIYLRNRMALRGRILEFDPYVLLLEPLDGSPAQMVYKSAVVSVSGPPQRGPRRGPGFGGDRGPNSPSGDRPGPGRPADRRGFDRRPPAPEQGGPGDRPQGPPQPSEE